MPKMPGSFDNKAAAAPAATGGRPEGGVEKFEIPLDPVDERSLEPTVLLIGALADYGDALGKIATEPKPDVSKELKDVMEKATKAQTIANGLLQLDLPNPAKLLTDQQLDGATKLIQFAAELLQEADKVIHRAQRSPCGSDTNPDFLRREA